MIVDRDHRRIVQNDQFNIHIQLVVQHNLRVRLIYISGLRCKDYKKYRFLFAFVLYRYYREVVHVSDVIFQIKT